MTNHRDRETSTAVVMRGLGINHTETVLSVLPMRGVGMNRSATVLRLARVGRGLTVNHAETVLRAPGMKADLSPITPCMG